MVPLMAGPGGITAARLGDIEQDGAGMVTPDRDLVTTRGEVDEVFRLPGNGAGGRRDGNGTGDVDQQAGAGGSG